MLATDSTLTGNVGTLVGGALFASGASSVVLDRCALVANSAEFGAGVHIMNSAVLALSNCTLCENTAHMHGGAIAADGDNVGANRCGRTTRRRAWGE